MGIETSFFRSVAPPTYNQEINMRDYVFVTSCVEANGDDINAMRRHPKCRVVQYDTMRRHCVGFIDWAISKGYRVAPGFGKKLTLGNDWHVCYYRSYYQGRPCYFLVWSAIEFIWVSNRKVLYE